MHTSRISASVVGTVIPMVLKGCGLIWWLLVAALPFLRRTGEVFPPAEVLSEFS